MLSLNIPMTSRGRVLAIFLLLIPLIVWMRLGTSWLSVEPKVFHPHVSRFIHTRNKPAGSGVFTKAWYYRLKTHHV